MTMLSATLAACSMWLALPASRRLSSASVRFNVGLLVRRLRAHFPAATRRARLDNSRRVIDFTQALVSLLASGAHAGHRLVTSGGAGNTARLVGDALGRLE